MLNVIRRTTKQRRNVRYNPKRTMCSLKKEDVKLETPPSKPVDPVPKPVKNQIFEKYGKNGNVAVESLDISYPIRIIGTRKPGRYFFWAWDGNVGLIKDKLNNNLWLTFQDSNGKTIGPIAYDGQLHSLGPKADISLRLPQVGLLNKECKDHEFHSIPQSIAVSGYDMVLPYPISVVFSPQRINLEDKELKLKFVGMGSYLIGITKFTSQAHYSRNPYVASSGWGLGLDIVATVYFVLTSAILFSGILTALGYIGRLLFF
eukprot:TRINITY_DN1746_c0_g1_i2.p1 TRINITY_DN1746_c0_g1~~TRINITY_DN1746_c0_g1_i2.p1  ORF type:complete len:260 (-),score=35.22 TRINITY_DN1746_c0_g1_i2:52-831(-)